MRIITLIGFQLKFLFDKFVIKANFNNANSSLVGFHWRKNKHAQSALDLPVLNTGIFILRRVQL